VSSGPLDDDMSDAPADLPLPTNGSDIQIQFDGEGIANLIVG